MKRTAYVVMVLVTLLYLVLGAVVFHFLEKDYEQRVKIDFAINHEKFLSNLSHITPDMLRQYVVKVLDTYGAGVSALEIMDTYVTGHPGAENDTANETLSQQLDDTGTRWDIASALLFCITLVSTIGYGNMAPKTDNGRLFCIFYAVIGIPMFAAVLVGTGERLQKPIKIIHNYRPWIKDNPSRDEKLKSIVLLALGICIIVFIPSLVFTKTQTWGFLEAIYFTVITLTTIGFGDLVPGYFDKPAKGTVRTTNMYRVILGLWILLGLSWGALVLSEIGSMLQTRITTAASQTQNKLSHLEGIVKKKAKATKDKIIKKDKEKEGLTTNGSKNGSPQVELTVPDSQDWDETDDYNPTNSDTELNVART